ncbi:MAG TPA: VWA domain-containing protein [Thermoanaerobaculia bacterium]|nr:VWA domain-containing protein [Thermoanaerobaculia bacterium]
MRTRIALSLSLLATLAFAQSRETVTVSVVEVPVTVLDAAGNPVRGLTAANFELIDEGKSRAITSFDVFDFASEESMKSASPMNPAARRSFMLLFDLSFSSPASLIKAQDAARAFVEQNAGKRDLVAVGTVDVDKGFRLLSAFTTDREIVRAAIGDPMNFKAFDPLQIAGAGQGNTDTGNSNAGQAGRGVDAEIREMTRRGALLDDQYNRARVEKQITNFGGLARALRGVAGRKQIVLLSEGFDPRFVQGREVRSVREQQVENEAASRGQIWNIDSDSRFGSAEGLNLLGKMADVFRRSDVILHAIDIQGVRATTDMRNGAKVNSGDALFMVANPTGGHVFRNTNDLKDDFARMLKQQEVVYVLAFSAPTTTPGKAHSLKVRLRNVPDAHIVYRSGYFEAGGEGQIERSLSNAEIIMNDMPVDDLHVAALAAPFPTTDANAQVPVILEIEGKELATSGRDNLATAEIYVYAFDADGKVRDSLFQRMGLDLTKVGAKLRAGGGIKYYGTLSLPPGSYAVKSLVRVLETESKGYARADVVVPGASEVAVSQPFFWETQSQWLMVKGGSHDKTNAGYPFVVNDETFIPRVRMQPGDRKFAVFVYNAPADAEWVATPQAKLVAQSRAGGVRKLVFELEAASSGEVTVTRK